MSAGTALPWADAYALAEHAAALLRPHVARLKVVGSIRRRKPRCGDIEFLAEPRMITTDLFGSQAPDVVPIRRELEQLGTWVKGGDRMMQITDFSGRPGLKLEVYLVHPPANWSAQLAIRTGPWELGREVMMRMKERGYGHDDGRPFRLDSREPVHPGSEEEWFGLAGLPCLPPHQRDDFAGELEAARLKAHTARRTG